MANNVCEGYVAMAKTPQLGYSINLTNGDVMMGAKGEQFLVFNHCPACGTETTNGVANCGGK